MGPGSSLCGKNRFPSTTLDDFFAPEIAERTQRLGHASSTFAETVSAVLSRFRKGGGQLASHIQPMFEHEKPSGLLLVSIG